MRAGAVGVRSRSVSPGEQMRTCRDFSRQVQSEGTKIEPSSATPVTTGKTAAATSSPSLFSSLRESVLGKPIPDNPEQLDEEIKQLSCALAPSGDLNGNLHLAEGGEYGNAARPIRREMAAKSKRLSECYKKKALLWEKDGDALIKTAGKDKLYSEASYQKRAQKTAYESAQIKYSIAKATWKAAAASYTEYKSYDTSDPMSYLLEERTKDENKFSGNIKALEGKISKLNDDMEKIRSVLRVLDEEQMLTQKVFTENPDPDSTR